MNKRSRGGSRREGGVGRDDEEEVLNGEKQST